MKKRLNFNFVKYTKVYCLISIVLILAIIATAVFAGVKADIEFTGGCIITYSYDGDIDLNEVKTAAEEAIGSEVNVQNSEDITTGKNNFVISPVVATSLTVEQQGALSDKMTEKFADNNPEMVDINNVNPTIGTEFFIKSMVAILFAFVLMILYIAIRFRKIGGWSAGAFAVIALLHDSLFVFGTFVVFGILLDNNFVAAVLTILGYSINSTIVVYDRVRENKSLYPELEVGDLVNKSINDTLARTFNSSLTTVAAMVIVCIVAFIYGIDSIISFAFPLVIGLIAGAYSSTCIAGPLWVAWRRRRAK